MREATPMQGNTVGGEGAPYAPAILLAAGASTRMGAVKALLPLDDGVPAVCHLAMLYEHCCGGCVVVTGYHAEAVEQALAAFRCGRPVRNPAPEDGQLSSLQCGLRALAEDRPLPGWFLFAPVDCFDLTPLALRALLDAQAVAGTDTLFCIPEFEGKRGHPVAARWEMAAAFLALSRGETARQVVRGYRDRTQFVPMPDSSVLADYDTPAELRARTHRLAARPVPPE